MLKFFWFSLNSANFDLKKNQNLTNKIDLFEQKKLILCKEIHGLRNIFF